jgi:hypothetical protein
MAGPHEVDNLVTLPPGSAEIACGDLGFELQDLEAYSALQHVPAFVGTADEAGIKCTDVTKYRRP